MLGHSCDLCIPHGVFAEVDAATHLQQPIHVAEDLLPGRPIHIIFPPSNLAGHYLFFPANPPPLSFVQPLEEARWQKKTQGPQKGFLASWSGTSQRTLPKTIASKMPWPGKSCFCRFGNFLLKASSNMCSV